MTEKREFLAPIVQTEQRSERVYLPPLLVVPDALYLSYPRTVLNNLLHEKRVTVLQALLLEDDIFEAYQDHYDTDAVLRGTIPQQSMSDISRRIEKRDIGDKVRYEQIEGRRTKDIEGTMRKILDDDRSVILGDTSHAILLAGEVEHKHVPIVEAFPDSREPKQVLIFSEVVEAVSKREKSAYVLRTKR